MRHAPALRIACGLTALLMAAGTIAWAGNDPASSSPAAIDRSTVDRYRPVDDVRLLQFGPGKWYSADGFVNTLFTDPNCPSSPDSMHAQVVYNHGQGNEYTVLAGHTTYNCGGDIVYTDVWSSAAWQECGCSAINGGPYGYQYACFTYTSQQGATCYP